MSTAVGVVLGLLSLVSVVASAVAVARASLAKGTIDVLKQSNEALAERVKILEEDNGRQAVRLAALTAENLALQTYVNGTDAIKELGVTLAASDKARGGEHHDILAAIHAQQTVVQAQHEEVLALVRATSHTHRGGT